MATVHALGLILACVRSAAALVASSPSSSPRGAEEVPEWLLEPWELAARDRRWAEEPSDGSAEVSPPEPWQLEGVVLARRGHSASPDEAEGPPPEPWELEGVALARRRHLASLDEGARFVPNKSILDFEQPGQCFAFPTADTYFENWGRIDADVKRGREQARSMSVIFAGLVRNAENSVRESYKMLRRIADQFQDYRFLLFENDSSDKTVQNMEIIKSMDPRYQFRTKRLSMGDERGLERSRMERMATLRNFVHDWVREVVGQTHRWDLIVIYDFDLNNFGQHVLSPHAFFGALGRQETLDNSWDMLCANSIRHIDGQPTAGVGMYDCFAYRDLNNNSVNAPECTTTHSAPLNVLFSQYPLIPVHSCFGGLAMYRPDKFLECQYDPSVYDCEHVVFHKCMRQRGSEGRMFMDPLLTTNYDYWTQLGCYSDAVTAKAHYKQDEVVWLDAKQDDVQQYPKKARCHDLLADSNRGDDVCNDQRAARSSVVKNVLQCINFCAGSNFVQWADPKAAADGASCRCYGEGQCEMTRAAASLDSRTRVYRCY